eukprot:10291587-Alexandrium_andersonii.AAC.1
MAPAVPVPPAAAMPDPAAMPGIFAFTGSHAQPQQGTPAPGDAARALPQMPLAPMAAALQTQ